MAAAPRVDIHPAASGVACINSQFGRLATGPDVHEHALYTMFVKFIVVAKTHDVLQQPCLLYLRSAVTDADTAPIRLACYQTIAFE